MPGTDLPEVQVRDSVAVNLQSLANYALGVPVGNHVEQHPPRIANQPIGPGRDDAGADEADHGVDPWPSEP